MLRVFIDVNIILDAWLARGDYGKAEAIIALVDERKIVGYWTTSVIHIAGYWLKKSYGIEQTKEILLNMAQSMTLIDASQLSVLRAINSDMTDIEDALQYYAAIEHHLDLFVTNDKKLRNAALPILDAITPTELLNRVKT